MATAFTIGPPEDLFSFEVEIDDGVLVSLIATDTQNNTYDCLLQLMPRDPEGLIFCCRPPSCTSGTCSS